MDSGIVRDNGAFGGKPHHKAHVQIQYGDSRIWARYVRGSINFLHARSTIENLGGFEGSDVGLLYEQLTVQGERRFTVTPVLSLDFRAGYDVHDLIRRRFAPPEDMEYEAAMREKELTLRSLLSWTPDGAHSLAAGVEHSREWFGSPPSRLTDDPAHLGNTLFTPWRTNTFSYFGEYQWNPTPRWTAFLGGRADKHTFTDWMYSPKAALVFSPAERHTTKLMYNRSVRKAEDKELKQEADAHAL